MYDHLATDLGHHFQPPCTHRGLTHCSMHSHATNIVACLLHAMHSVQDWGPQANLGELTHCSGPQMTSCPGVTVTVGRRSRPQIVTYLGLTLPQTITPMVLWVHDQPSLVDRLHYSPPPPRPARPLAHKPGGTRHGHTRAPVHRSCCRTAPQAEGSGLEPQQALWRSGLQAPSRLSQRDEQPRSRLRTHCVLSNPHSPRWRN